MIKLEQVQFGYGRSHRLFTDISFELPTGSITGLLGRNGEGKSTLMKLITGQLLPRGGKLAILGEDPTKRGVSLLSKVYYLPEEVQMPPISIREYFACYAPFYPTYDASVAEILIQEFDLKWEMNLGKLSLGQKKKASIAFALAIRVPLLLMDEPTNGLDIPSKSVFRRIVARYASNEQTIIISTHQVRDLEQLIDRLLLMDGNRIICNDTIAHITDRLSFAPVTPQNKREVLYREGSILGELGVFPRQDNSAEGEFSMELFFNAVVAEKGKILSILNYK